MVFADGASGSSQTVVIPSPTMSVEVSVSFFAEQAPSRRAAVAFGRAVSIITPTGNGQSPHFLAGRVASSPVSNIVQGPGAFFNRRPLFTFHLSPHGADRRDAWSVFLRCLCNLVQKIIASKNGFVQ